MESSATIIFATELSEWLSFTFHFEGATQLFRLAV